MTTVTTLALPRKPARPQETRVAPRPHVRLELHGLCSPIDQRVLPTIDGAGLEPHERDRVARARNRAEAAWSLDCDPCELDLAASVGRAAAREELRRVLRERAHARPLVVKGKRDARDEAFWATYTAPHEVSPIRRLVEGRRKEWETVGVVESGLVGNMA